VTFPLSGSEKATVVAAMQACGIPVPAPTSKFSPDQQACLAAHGVTFPLSGSEKATVVAAMQVCGIPVPGGASAVKSI
jgi:hypothetical protein